LILTKKPHRGDILVVLKVVDVDNYQNGVAVAFSKCHGYAVLIQYHIALWATGMSRLRRFMVLPQCSVGAPYLRKPIPNKHKTCVHTIGF
jgi:hypothetical protein